MNAVKTREGNRIVLAEKICDTHALYVCQNVTLPVVITSYAILILVAFTRLYILFFYSLIVISLFLGRE